MKLKITGFYMDFTAKPSPILFMSCNNRSIEGFAAFAAIARRSRELGAWQADCLHT